MAHIVQQPMLEKPMTNWNTGLCDCFADCSTCCYGFWCCPCLACTVSGSFGENQCLPLCDICSPAILSACGIPLFVPPALLSLRAALRNRYNIKGSLCEDIAVSCCCVWCSWCQLQRELKYRKKVVTVVNMQPQHIINVQQQGPVVNSQPVFVGQQQQFQPQLQPQLQPQQQPQLQPQLQPQPVIMTRY